MADSLVALATTLMRDNVDFRIDTEASIAMLMRVSGCGQDAARAAVRSATEALDVEDAAYWRRMHARAKAGKPLFD